MALLSNTLLNARNMLREQIQVHSPHTKDWWLREEMTC